jgi:tetratricopeptide (TPR) repeat protein
MEVGMARSSQQKQKHKQRKLRQRKARKQKKNARSASLIVPEPSAKIARKMDEIFEWLDEEDTDYALELLETLVKSSPRVAAVAEAELGIYQSLDNHEQASHAAKRFLKLVPENPEAMFGYGQAALFCARSCIAFIQFRKFLDRWPNHEWAANAHQAIEICETESRRRVRGAYEKGDLGLEFEEGGLAFYARHEESLEQMSGGNMSEAIALIEQNLAIEPQFMSSRNNLAICLFYKGDLEKAVQTARETCDLSPENRFAQANLIKFEFLTGNPEKANELANAMIADPPTEQDAYTSMVGALSFLGRDEDIVVLSQMLEKVTPIDDDKKCLVLHHYAVANFRMGDRNAAIELWNHCLELCLDHPEAQANLGDLEMNIGHAAWSEPINKWLPRPFLLGIIKKYEDAPTKVSGTLARKNPVVATLVPALLDRGDPTAREFALNFACTDATPQMLQALKDFAFSTRGPDSLRHKAMMKLKEESLIDAGPHRFFSRGKWTSIKLIAAEITHEPFQVEPWKRELLEEGYWAMAEGKLDIAATAFRRVLDRDPDCRSARFNLASVWQRRGGSDEVQNAEQEIRRLHSEHPDYSFAAMAVAITEAQAGNFDRAKDLLGDILEKPKLHCSEAMMLFSSQVQVALAQNDSTAAETAWNAMRQIAEDDDPRVSQLRHMIDTNLLARLPDF